MATSAREIKVKFPPWGDCLLRRKLCVHRECQEILTLLERTLQKRLVFSVLATSLRGGWKWKCQAILWSRSGIKGAPRGAVWGLQSLQTEAPRVLSHQGHPGGVKSFSDLWAVFQTWLSPSGNLKCNCWCLFTGILVFFIKMPYV